MVNGKELKIEKALLKEDRLILSGTIKEGSALTVTYTALSKS